MKRRNASRTPAALVASDELGNTNNHEADGRRHEPPVAVLIVPGITRTMSDFGAQPLEPLGAGKEGIGFQNRLDEMRQEDRIGRVLHQVAALQRRFPQLRSRLGQIPRVHVDGAAEAALVHAKHALDRRTVRPKRREIGIRADRREPPRYLTLVLVLQPAIEIAQHMPIARSAGANQVRLECKLGGVQKQMERRHHLGHPLGQAALRDEYPVLLQVLGGELPPSNRDRHTGR